MDTPHFSSWHLPVDAIDDLYIRTVMSCDMWSLSLYASDYAATLRYIGICEDKHIDNWETVKFEQLLP